MNLATVNSIYTNPNIIKSVMDVKRENKLLRTPRQSTIDRINDELKFCPSLSRESLLKRTRMSGCILDNALRYLVLNGDLIKKVTGNQGPHDKFVYLLVRA